MSRIATLAGNAGAAVAAGAIGGAIVAVWPLLMVVNSLMRLRGSRSDSCRAANANHPFPL